MNTNTNTNEATEAKGTDPLLADAAKALAMREAKTFPDLVKLCVKLADADGMSKLGDTERAVYIASLVFGRVGGSDVKMSAPTYSKRVKIGRLANALAVDGKGTKLDVTNLALFTERCESPSLDKFYEWLPKNAAMSKPRAAKSDKPVSAPKADTKAEPDVKVKVAPVEVILGLLPHLSAADLDRIAAEIVRRRTPVSTKAA